MSNVISLNELNLTGIGEYPPDESVKLWGPPGTGKTTQSAGRVARLLDDYGYELGDVAWCTYRKSLALDTLERFVAWGFISEADLEDLHKGSTRHINTIHAVANRCVGDLPDPVESWHKSDFCDRMDMRFWASEPWEDTAGQLLFRTFEWMNNNCLDPAKPADVRQCPVVNDLTKCWNGDVSAAWNKWEDYKAQRDIIDFHEMLSAPLNQNVVPTDRVLVVDEYHDATALMAKLCEYWIDQAEIVIVAGDPNQVVNAFDGADPRFFKRVDLPRVLLDKTYRVPEEHWQTATRLLSKAHEIPPVERQSHGSVIEYRSPQFEHSDESGWVRPGGKKTASPPQIVEEFGDDTLFLTRMQMQADGVGAALERAGIFYTSQTDLEGWNTENAENRLALYNALQKVRDFDASHFDGGYGLGQYSDQPRSPDGTSLAYGEAIAILEHAHASTLAQRRSDTDDICDELEAEEEAVTLTELNEWVENEFWNRYSNGPASVSRLNKGSLSDRDQRAIHAALKRHVDPVNAEDIDVHALTIHASKGQEAQDVVVYDGISRRIRREMRSSERARDNEWRTWYVAFTRASERLHIMRNAFEWTSSIIPPDIRQVNERAAKA